MGKIELLSDKYVRAEAKKGIYEAALCSIRVWELKRKLTPKQCLEYDSMGCALCIYNEDGCSECLAWEEDCIGDDDDGCCKEYHMAHCLMSQEMRGVGLPKWSDETLMAIDALINRIKKFAEKHKGK